MKKRAKKRAKPQTNRMPIEIPLAHDGYHSAPDGHPVLPCHDPRDHDTEDQAEGTDNFELLNLLMVSKLSFSLLSK